MTTKDCAHTQLQLATFFLAPFWSIRSEIEDGNVGMEELSAYDVGSVADLRVPENIMSMKSTKTKKSNFMRQCPSYARQKNASLIKGHSLG